MRGVCLLPSGIWLLRFTGLYTASMSRMKDHVELMERLRELVNNFPRIVGRCGSTRDPLQRAPKPARRAPGILLGPSAPARSLKLHAGRAAAAPWEQDKRD